MSETAEHGIPAAIVERINEARRHVKEVQIAAERAEQNLQDLQEWVQEYFQHPDRQPHGRT